ncbi:MAG: BatD family protein [bacterium]
MYVLIIYFLWTTARVESDEPPVKVAAEVDQTTILIGDRITYKVTVEADPEVDLVPPDATANLAGFEIKDYKVSGPKKSWWTKKVVTVYEYTFTIFATGEYEIPPLLVEYTYPKAQRLKSEPPPNQETEEIKHSVSTKAIKILVEGVKPSIDNKDDIRDIKSPLSIPYSRLFYLVLASILLVIGGAIGGYLFYQRRKVREVVSAPLRSPEEIAYERLKNLNGSNLLAEGKLKKYYIILSETIRAYLEAKFEIPVLDRTTNELYEEMRQAELDQSFCHKVKDFLEQCDLVKFAKYRPTRVTIEADFETGWSIVRASPKPQTPEVWQTPDV